MIDEKPMKDVTNISLKMNYERGSCENNRRCIIKTLNYPILEREKSLKWFSMSLHTYYTELCNQLQYRIQLL